MAGNTQMNENERGLFKLNGITGMFVALVIIIGILVWLITASLFVQQREANNYYKINQDLNGLTSGSTFSEFKQNSSDEQRAHYELVGSNK